MWFIKHPVSVFGTVGVLVIGWLVITLGQKFISSRTSTPKEEYRKQRLFSTIVLVAGAIIIFGLWSKQFQHTSTFLGLIGAGLAVALREPLLSIAGRIAIFVGRMYTAGDRIEINNMSGDVIDVGFFYTRMMEIGNWIGGDQYSGRIIQFANAQVFGASVFNYTRNFAYIWDEIKLPLTYASNIPVAMDMLKTVGGEYTREFMAEAEPQIATMERIFAVQRFEVEPIAASSFIFIEVFRQIRERKDIEIGSSTMTLTLQNPEALHASEDQHSDEQPPKAA